VTAKKETKLKFYELMAVPIVLCGNGTWGQKDAEKVTALKCVKGFTRSHKI
jgi:hypothetical protein